MTNSLSKVEAFLSALQEQSLFKDTGTQGSVVWYIDFYQQRAPSRRKAFRASGFILLFLSISLPFITQISPVDWQPKVASVLAWLIALVAAANAFFNWQKAWQSCIPKRSLPCNLRFQSGKCGLLKPERPLPMKRD